MFRHYRENLTAQLAPGTALEIGQRTRSHYSETGWPLAVETLFFFALIATCVRPRLHPLRLGAWAAFFQILAPFGNALGVSLVHALDISRYRVTFGGYLLFALSAMVVVVIATVMVWVFPEGKSVVMVNGGSSISGLADQVNS
jgi:hypothetical protein